MTDKQQAFVDEYLVDMNATQAAVRAGYSEHTARSKGSSLLTKVDIRKAVTEAQARRGERVAVTQDDVIQGLLFEARNMGGTPAARVAAWVHLGKHVGMFNSTVRGQPAEGKVNVFIQMNEARDSLTRRETKSEPVHIIGANRTATPMPRHLDTSNVDV